VRLLLSTCKRKWESLLFKASTTPLELVMLKTITFAVVHFATAFTVAYLITGSAIVGGAVALVEPAVNTVVFYFHEKLWTKYDIPELFSHFTAVASHRA